MSFGDAVVSAFTKYAVFSGRARRREFWFFHLFNLIIIVCMNVICSLFDEDIGVSLTLLYWLAVLVPSYALIWRRLQDTGRSGFLYFLSFIPLVGWVLVFVWLCMEGQCGPNPYGPDPKAPAGGPSNGAF